MSTLTEAQDMPLQLHVDLQKKLNGALLTKQDCGSITPVKLKLIELYSVTGVSDSYVALINVCKYSMPDTFINQICCRPHCFPHCLRPGAITSVLNLTLTSFDVRLT